MNYKGQKYAITQNILYVSIQSVVYLHVFRLKKRRFEFFDMRRLLTLLLQTGLDVVFFLMANTVKGFST